MSVYIPEMRMPEGERHFRVVFDQCGNPYLMDDDDEFGLWHLLPVKDHGRLCDLDALQKQVSKICSRFDNGIIGKLAALNQILVAIDNAEVIISAEGGT